ncbi:MAG: T9SS type A sorting domain-containing protein [Flavobacteriaceae bacterium]|nr:T9SS type A sorting domain-containing protein [Flavobacteriaceae bacterium]
MKKLYFLLFTILISGLSFGQVFITELADPNNNANARYIELYNAGASPVDFTEGTGWRIDKYTNASATVSQTLSLTGTIPAGGFYIIAAGATSTVIFNTWGVTPDQWDGAIDNVAGSNGDDNLELYDGTNTLVDQFGVPGEDGTGTCHEFEDGRAERKTSVTTGSATWNEAEWNIWADSATSGSCTSYVFAAQDAPGNFDPGVWGTPTCDLILNNPSATCDVITTGVDTYTATVNFSGGGTATYTVTADSGSVDLTGGDPTTDATGTITVTGVAEGTDVIINVTDGSICDVDYTVFSPICYPPITLPHYENFAYADGSLSGNSAWASSGGTAGDLLVSSGQVLVKADNTTSEDLYLPFTSVTGKIYFGIDITVNAAATISGDDYEYFAHFKDSGFGYFGRLDIVAPSASGDYTLGISTESSTAQATWGTDLTFGVTYRAVVMYDQDANISQLWIDASADTDPSILGTDLADPGISIESFQLRQSGSSGSETITVDNLNIGTTFGGVLSTKANQIQGFAMYPNPTSLGYVTLSSKNNTKMNVAVYDMLGKQVLNKTVTNNKLDVTSLNSGVYIMKVSQDNASVTKKLVIQ